MPFCADDVEGDMPHGHPANSPWAVLEAGAAHVSLRLSQPVRGATVTKTVRIAGTGLYQSHLIEGGTGEVTLAHHPMAHMAGGGRLSYSPKRLVRTDPKPQYAGRNLWALNQLRPDLRLDCEDGSVWDLHDYPAQHAVEDFVILVEARGARLGWTVLLREAEDDMIVVLKDARQFPVTMLWISNGGRDFPPWNARHTGVIGIEDGIAAGATGLSYAMGDNPLRAAGVPTTLALGPRIDIRHAMVRLPRPAGWSRVETELVADAWPVDPDRGQRRARSRFPFDDSHFAP